MSDPTFPPVPPSGALLDGDPGAGDDLDGRAFRVDEPAKAGGRNNLMSWVVTIAIALALTFVVKTWVFQAYSIPSDSMVPTLIQHDRVLVSKLNTDPGRGDIIVFKRPANDPGGPNDPEVLIKRVIGLPGETITAQDGDVYINGKKLIEDYLPKAYADKTVIQTAITVESGKLLVLGDNRGISLDGRTFGTISKDLIVGRAVLRIWPPSRMGSL